MVKLPSRKALADRLDKLERDAAIFAAGGGTGAALARSAALRGAAGTAALRLTPAALLADLVIRQEESLAYQAGEAAAPYLETAALDPIRAGISQLEPGPMRRSLLAAQPPRKRKVSKANKAVKYGMSLLKAGSKKTTGADKGKLAKGSFKIATVAAGLANPKTKSTIGKGKSKVKALARRIKKWW